MSISAVIITQNEEANIHRCLSSLKGVADEIIIIDSGSKDQTAQISLTFKAKVFQKRWEGYSKAKNYGNSLATSTYILSIDADEALSDELKQNILQFKSQLNGAYQLNRLSNYCGKWIYHCGWYPDIKVRLFPKGKAHWEGDFVHERLILDKNIVVKQLSGHLYHYTIQSVEDHIERINRYSSLAAKEMFQKGEKPSTLKVIFRPVSRFVKMYLVKGGWKDGFLGYVICRNSAYAMFLRLAKLKSMQLTQFRKEKQMAEKSDKN